MTAKTPFEIANADVLDLDEEELFPASDGQPMADNTKQFRWIVIIKENLEVLFTNNPDVFVAGDLLWYPEQSQLVSPVAPDVMVAFGRPKGERTSYKQWRENNIPPQVVFEILSPSNGAPEMAKKLAFYQRYGVSEYYLYDPDAVKLQGWLRQGESLLPVANLNGWKSPMLGISFNTSTGDLAIYYPDGSPFLSTVELRALTNQEAARANQEAARANQEAARANQEAARANQEVARAEKLAQKLRELGIDPDAL